jgi:hypothetical protein
MREPEEHERNATTQTIEVEGLACLVRQLKIVELEQVLGDPDAFVRIRERDSAGQTEAKHGTGDSAQPGRHWAVMLLNAVTAS